MAHEQLIAEALATSALERLFDSTSRSDSALVRWLDEVSVPPPDLHVGGSSRFSGAIFVIRNRIRRALVFKHRDHNDAELHSEPPPQHPVIYEDDDEFPGFG